MICNSSLRHSAHLYKTNSFSSFINSNRLTPFKPDSISVSHREHCSYFCTFFQFWRLHKWGLTLVQLSTPKETQLWTDHLNSPLVTLIWPPQINSPLETWYGLLSYTRLLRHDLASSAQLTSWDKTPSLFWSNASLNNWNRNWVLDVTWIVKFSRRQSHRDLPLPMFH
jgi:hypothetical protein